MYLYELKTLHVVVKSQSKNFNALKKWFLGNTFVLNFSKCHFVTLGFKCSYLYFKIKKLALKMVAYENY